MRTKLLSRGGLKEIEELLLSWQKGEAAALLTFVGLKCKARWAEPESDCTIK